MNNSDKVILVTGASSGIGRSCAEYLSRQGCRVYGTSRRADLADSEQRTSNTGLLQLIPMDVTDESSVHKGIESILARESRIDVVVNNAGFAIIGSLEDTTIAEVKSQFETNFLGCLAGLPGCFACNAATTFRTYYQHQLHRRIDRPAFSECL